MKEIKLNKGYIALVDDENFQDLNQYYWHVFFSRNGLPSCVIRYKGSKERKIRIYMHHQVLNVEIDALRLIDHKNHNPLDNRKENLRTATSQQNCFNRRKLFPKTSKYKGVHFRKDRLRWISTIKINGKKLYLGYFLQEEDAALAYNNKAKELFGEYACLNII